MSRPPRVPVPAAAPLAQRRVRRRRRSLFGVIAAVALSLPAGLPSASGVTGPADQIGQWGSTVSWPTMGKHMVLMHTNEVLVFSTGNDAHVWDLGSNTFAPSPTTFGDIHCAAHVTLADGRVFIVGGVNGDPFVGIKLAAMFDPTTNTWTNKTPMTYARWYPTATTLGDGRVLATSGTDQNKVKITTPEVYDPATDRWSTLAARTQPIYPFMYLLPNGKVYDAAPKSGTALLDVANGGSWTAGPTSGWDNSNGCCSESGAMYGIGKIIRSGGNDPAIARTGTIDMTAASPAWQETAPMAFPRRRHNMVILADGQVMAVGGTRRADDATQAVLDGEIWNPDTRSWTTVAPMAQPRMYHSAALLLPDGRVVIAGGDTPDAGKRTAQIYSPPYLFKGARPAITTSPQSTTYGETFTVGTDTSGVSSVALVRPGAVTHAIDMNQRYVPLTFSQSGGTLSVTAPASGNVAPPGYYMLLVENANGVPSVASWIRVGPGGSTPPPPPPTLTAGFTASPTSGAAPLTVSFADTTTGSPTKWEWDFNNDGTVDSTDRNPVFTYSSANTYSVRLRVTDAAGASDEEVKASYITATQASGGGGSGTTTTFSAEADARVQEASSGTNYGTSYIRTDGGTDPDVESYLRFPVAGLSGSVTSARLRIYATSGTGNGPAVYTADDTSWSETGITWNNRPRRSTTGVDDKGSITANSWIEFDVTALVSGNGSRTFVLATSSSDGVDLSSREASNTSLRPQLVVTTAASTTPSPPTADFSATPTSGAAPLTVSFTDRSVDASTWAWDFQNDQGFDSTDRNPTFTYTEPGTYTVRLQVENGVGGDEEIKTNYVTVTSPSPAGSPFTVNPVADAKVRSSTPTKNYGTATDLQVRLGNSTTPHTFRSYLQFAVSGLSGPPRSAKLRLYVTDASSQGGVAYAVPSAWTEAGLTWDTAPPLDGTPLVTLGAVTLNTWKEIDVTSTIGGNGTYSFAIKEGTSSDSAIYSSREGANQPQLVITP